ncbi:PD-(D/E)XK nuclease family protein [Sporosarcina sp. ACRSL]|uniref:PDDEXK-like family protein n=1 Tax=Sporosarcina sp. ACRSL TaxID=2918215 RepID=UPI001EF6E28C|nr:PD-(D/E)XK nuclease family protein [Sporosarcina sp. ACRSL]MCG7344814.1 PD-(D/E)XK nuclease family protein [Sporosarcina sp. ACRSL]
MPNHQQQILTLIEDSQEFTYLHNHFNRFNPFKVLQVDNYEIRHSNVLAWLMDPQQNHDLGSYFIKKLIAKVFVNPANYEDEDKIANYDVLQLSRHSYHDLVVYKELATSNGKRIDLLAVSDLYQVAVLIENKFWSTESEGQLEEYIEFVRTAYAGYKIIPVFLTLQDEEPTHEDYLMLGYSDVLDILNNMTDANKDYMHPDVHSFISYYIDILEDQLVQNDELNEKGMALYKNHKEAVDLLSSAGKGSVVENSFANELSQIYNQYKETIDFVVKVGSSFLREAFIRFARNLGWPEHLYTPHFKVPHFIEKTWDEHFDANDLRKKWWMNKGLIAWFEQADDRLKLRVEVGPLHHEDRVRLLQALKVRGVDVKEQAFEEGRQYTRIYMDADRPNSWEDVDFLVESMERLYKKESFQSLLRLTNEAVVVGDDDNIQIFEPTELKAESPLETAFTLFVNEQRIPSHHYNVNHIVPSFVEPEWTQLPSKYEVTEKYWLGYPLIAWFRRRNSTVRLIVEVGPMPHLERTRVLKSIEEQGIPVRALAYEEGRRFTRIYSRAVPVEDMEDTEELKVAMEQLFSANEYIAVREGIARAIEGLRLK